ncbi:hypothetical protein HK097_009146 [Rhizophlyctis rosea]|uniref:FAD/NAD(P)-binding domain-containing protein n=1 Tax=Rhizophlyctis rosea TaxID=64517 RepID=A0AAD5SBK1_9FUNG|nr:hypothetical protein HK097_009146 [Rhizophlyctis rosea]
MVHPQRRWVTSIGKPRGRLVILGSGWAGLKILKGINTKDYDVVMISPRNHFVFTPLLASTAVGTLEFRAIVEPVRIHNKDAAYYQAWCDGVDLEKKELVCQPALPDAGPLGTNTKFNVAFDKLIIAVGAYSNTFGVPGVVENGFFLKEIDHARRLRARIIECFELASEPTTSDEDKLKLSFQRQRHMPTVSTSLSLPSWEVDQRESSSALNYTVTSLTSGSPNWVVPYQNIITDFIKDDLTKLYPQLMSKVQISVYDVAEKILGGFDVKLQEYAMKKFSRDGIKIKTKTFIKEVQKHKIVLKDGSEIPFGALVWATGITETPLTKSLDVTKDKRTQRVITDDFLRLLRKDGTPMQDVYALGDCAMIKDHPLPATAQVAAQQGTWLKKHLNDLAKFKEDKQPFTYHHAGSMVYTGSWKALMDRGDPTDPKHENTRTNLSGRLAWLIWRSAYLTKSVSAKNKALIPMYWFLTWLFGRDISKF